jgi:hypothetical protein
MILMVAGRGNVAFRCRSRQRASPHNNYLARLWRDEDDDSPTLTEHGVRRSLPTFIGSRLTSSTAGCRPTPYHHAKSRAANQRGVVVCLRRRGYRRLCWVHVTIGVARGVGRVERQGDSTRVRGAWSGGHHRPQRPSACHRQRPFNRADSPALSTRCRPTKNGSDFRRSRLPSPTLEGCEGRE